MKYLLALIQLLTKLRLHIVSAWLMTHILYQVRVTRKHRKKPTWICVGDEAIIIMSFICRLRSSSISLLKSSSNMFSWILNLRFFFVKFYVSFSKGMQFVLKQNKDNFVKKSCRFVDSGIVKICDELDLCFRSCQDSYLTSCTDMLSKKSFSSLYSSSFSSSSNSKDTVSSWEGRYCTGHF